MYDEMHLNPQSLPCNDCPYGGVCCTYGVTISPREQRAIVARFGADAVYMNEDGDWRTAVRDNHCIFQAADGRCTIHAEAFYPVQCRAYPWHPAELRGDEFVAMDVAYPQPYECPAMVLAALDAQFRRLQQHPERFAQSEALIIQLIPLINE